MITVSDKFIARSIHKLAELKIAILQKDRLQFALQQVFYKTENKILACACLLYYRTDPSSIEHDDIGMDSKSCMSELQSKKETIS